MRQKLIKRVSAATLAVCLALLAVIGYGSFNFETALAREYNFDVTTNTIVDSSNMKFAGDYTGFVYKYTEDANQTNLYNKEFPDLGRSVRLSGTTPTGGYYRYATFFGTNYQKMVLGYGTSILDSSRSNYNQYTNYKETAWLGFDRSLEKAGVTWNAPYTVVGSDTAPAMYNCFSTDLKPTLALYDTDNSYYYYLLRVDNNNSKIYYVQETYSSNNCVPTTATDFSTQPNKLFMVAPENAFGPVLTHTWTDMTENKGYNALVYDTAADPNYYGNAYTGGTTTLKCEEISNKQINRAAMGIKYTFHVTDVCTNQQTAGEKKYVSAVIYDSNKNPLYYSRLKEVPNLVPAVGTAYPDPDDNGVPIYQRFATTEMDVDLEIPWDPVVMSYSKDYMISVFEETVQADGVCLVSQPVYANMTVSNIESIYAYNTSMSEADGAPAGSITETHKDGLNPTSTNSSEPVSNATLITDTKTYRDDQVITDKSNFTLVETQNNPKAGIALRQVVIPANEYYMLDWEDWEFYATYLYVNDTPAEQSLEVLVGDGMLSYTNAATNELKKSWVESAVEYYRQIGRLDFITTRYLPTEQELLDLDASVGAKYAKLGRNALNKIDIPAFKEGQTRGTKDVAFLVYKYDTRHANPRFYTYRKTLNITTAATGNTDSDSSIVQANIWYDYTDDLGIAWKYMVDNNGEVGYLYTKDTDAVAKLTSEGPEGSGCEYSDKSPLIVPTTINGIPVAGIGGGEIDKPFLPYDTEPDDGTGDPFYNIVFPTSCKKINDYAFYGSTMGWNLILGTENTTATGELTIPQTVQEIGNFAFHGNNFIKSVTINGKDTKIGYRAFEKCNQLKTLKVVNTDTDADTIGSIGERAFASCPNLYVVVLSGPMDIEARAFLNDSKIGRAKTKLEKVDGTLNISNLSGMIKFEAFRGCSRIKKLYIPETVTFETSIDVEHGYQFRDCTSLTQVECESAELKDNVFYNCPNITEIILGKNVTKVSANWGGYEGDAVGTLGGNIERKFYVKSDTTVFEFKKSSSSVYSSSFGFKNGATEHHNNQGTVDVYFFALAGNTGNYTMPQQLPDGTISLSGSITAILNTYENAAAMNNQLEPLEPMFNASGAATVNLVKLTDANDERFKGTFRDPAYTTGIEVVQKKNLYESSTFNKTYFTVKPALSDGSNSLDEYENYYMLRTEDWMALLSSGAAREKEDSFLTACDSMKIPYNQITLNKIEDGKSMDYVDITFVVFNEDSSPYTSNETLSYTLLTDEAAKEQILEESGVSDYKELLAQYNDTLANVTALQESTKQATEQIESLQQELEEKSSLSEQEIAEKNSQIESLNADLTDYRSQLDACTQKYLDLVDKMSSYAQSIGSSEDVTGGYISTETTEEGTKEIVFINGQDSECQKTEETVTVDGKEYDVYETVVDMNDDGEEEVLKFYVDKNGVHVFNKDGEDIEEEIYTDTLNAAMRQLTSQLTELGNKLNAITSALSNVEKELGITTDQIGTKNQVERLNLILDRVKDLNSSIVSYQNSIKTVYSLLSSESLTDEQIANLNEVLNTITSKINTLKSENTSLTEEVERLSQELGTAAADKADLQGVVEELQGTISTQSDRIAQLEAEATEYLMTIDDAIELFDLKRNSSKEDIMEAINGYIAAKATVTKVQATLDTAKDGDELIAVLQNKLSAASNNSGSGNTQIPSGSGNSGGSSNDTLSYQTGYNEGYKAGLKDGASSGSSSGNTNTGTTGNVTITALQNENTMLKSQNTTLQSEKKAAETKVTTLEAEKKTAETKVTTLETANAKLETENEAMVTQVTTLSSGIDDLYAAIPGMVTETNTLMTLSSNFSPLGLNTNTLQSQTVGLSMPDMIQTAAKVNKVKEYYGSLNADLKAKQKEISTLKDKNTTLSGKNKTLANKVTTLTKQVKTLQGRNSSLDQKNKTLSGNNKALTTKNQTLQNTNNALRLQANSSKYQSNSSIANTSSSSGGSMKSAEVTTSKADTSKADTTKTETTRSDTDLQSELDALMAQTNSLELYGPSNLEDMSASTDNGFASITSDTEDETVTDVADNHSVTPDNLAVGGDVGYVNDSYAYEETTSNEPSNNYGAAMALTALSTIAAVCIRVLRH